MEAESAPRVRATVKAPLLLSIFHIRGGEMFKPLILALRTGYRVQNTAAEDLGKVEEVVLDETSGKIIYAVIAYGGLLHGGTRLIAVPWERLRMQREQKEFFFNIDKETLVRAPHFER